MPLTPEQIANGLTPDHDYFFPEKPDDPEMRESTSVWLFEENGEFGFPRIGIEAEAHSWENRMYQINMALGDGQLLIDSGRGPAPATLGPDGKPSVLGAGPLTFRCIEPFRRWLMTFEGTVHQGTIGDQIAGGLGNGDRVPLSVEVELAIETPAWIQDYSPDKVARMTKAEQEDAQSMGIGWRLEQMVRGTGVYTVDGVTREFRCQGSRIKRQSIRPLNVFRGHCWQSAIFPDGSAFGYIAYPATATAAQFSIGYVVQDGVMYPARPTRIPYIRQVVEEGDDVSLELESQLGTHHISGATTLSTFKVNNPDMAAAGAPGFTLQQSGTRYTWNGQTSYGMIERSATGKQMEQGYEL